MGKICTYCKEEKNLDEYTFDKRSKDGRQSCCKECNNLKVKQKYKTDAYFKESVKNRASTWYQENTDHKKEYDKKRVEENKFTIYAKNKQHRDLPASKIKAKERYSRYYQDNKLDFFVRAAQRRSIKNRATPTWANREKIKQLYADCQLLTEMTGVPYSVDHIIPLKGKLVSGLHVEYNLQIIPLKENLAKHNKLIEDLL